MDVSRRVLTVALIISTVAHASLLGVRFSVPDEFRMRSKDTQMDVILVNAKHASKPVKAEALAQANLDGGGDAAKGRAQSFLTNSRQIQVGDQLQEAQRRAQQIEAEQKKLLSALQQSPNKVPAMSVQPQAQPDNKQAQQPTNGVDAAENARVMRTAEAELQKRIEIQNSRPKRGYVTPSTREVPEAMYMKAWTDKIEKIGNERYPDKARGGSYELTITVSILADGRVENIVIEKSSGSKALDDAVRRIIRAGEPYGRFPPALRAQFGVLDLTNKWTFSRNDALSVDSQR